MVARSIYDETVEVYRGSAARVAAQLLGRLREDGSALYAAHGLVAALGRDATVTNELFDEYRDELEAVRRGHKSIEWIVVGDPSVHVSCSGDVTSSGIVPAFAAEYAHAQAIEHVRVVEYEMWVSHLVPVFADHWYIVDYSQEARTWAHLPLPASEPPEVALKARSFMRAYGYRRIGRRELSRPVGFVPNGRRETELRLFELLFSAAHRRRLVFDTSGYRARRLRFGSTLPPPGVREPGALLKAFPDLDASWHEEHDAGGRVLARELSLQFADGTRVAVHIDERGQLALATSGRHPQRTES